jgi:hypothetical protein
MTGPGIFLIKSDQELVELAPSLFPNESHFQGLLERYPGLLAGSQIDPASPRRWLLVARESGVPSEKDGGARWSVDHLFLDQDGVPTFVEVKRSTDTRIRREVVGQMMDYAAHAIAYWPTEHIQASLEARCAREGRTVDEAVRDVIGPDGDVEQFWREVKRNLQAERVRLLFVADEIPPELRRVVEFLNRQMDPAEVLAIEIKRYTGQGGFESLVPRVYGQTEQALQRKAPGSVSSAPAWTEDRFFADLESRRGRAEATVARQIHDWIASGRGRIVYGKGETDGSLLFFTTHTAGSRYEPSPFGIWSNGKIEIHFQYLAYYPPFDSEELRRALLERLNAIQGVRISEQSLTRRPGVPLSALVAPEALQSFLSTFSWVVDRLKQPSVEK